MITSIVLLLWCALVRVQVPSVSLMTSVVFQEDVLNAYRIVKKTYDIEIPERFKN